MERVFDNIPEAQVQRKEWQGTYRELADRGRETTWGLREQDKCILGVCVMLEEAEAAYFSEGAMVNKLAGEVTELRNTIKGLQLEKGRMRKYIESLKQSLLPDLQDEAEQPDASPTKQA